MRQLKGDLACSGDELAGGDLDKKPLPARSGKHAVKQPEGSEKKDDIHGKGGQHVSRGKASGLNDIPHPLKDMRGWKDVGNGLKPDWEG